MSTTRVTRAVLASEWGQFCTAYNLQMRGRVGEEGWTLDCWQPGDGASYYAVEYYDAQDGGVYCPTYPMGERRLTAREMFEALRFARMVRAYMTGGM